MHILVPSHNDAYSLALSIPRIAQVATSVSVLDDGSIDSTRKVCRWLCRRYANVGAHANKRPVGWTNVRNQMLQYTNARHVVFMDADDILAPNANTVLQSLAGSKASHVELGLIELWGDMNHGTGRGFERPHHDPCHCYIDRELCDDVEWQQVASHAVPVSGHKPTRTSQPIFFHAKGVKSDWRLVARKQFNELIEAGGLHVDSFEELARDEERLHELAMERLLHDDVDPIMRLPPHIRVPANSARFEMIYQHGVPVDRIDHGWSLEGIGQMPRD